MGDTEIICKNISGNYNGYFLYKQEPQIATTKKNNKGTNAAASLFHTCGTVWSVFCGVKTLFYEFTQNLGSGHLHALEQRSMYVYLVRSLIENTLGIVAILSPFQQFNCAVVVWKQSSPRLYIMLYNCMGVVVFQ